MFGKKSSPPALSLALQGGGAHGAFTWGVLDRLLDEPSLRLDGVSGASAGAMNAVVLAQGLMEGGPEGARKALANFWAAIATSVPVQMAVPTADGEGVRLTALTKLMMRAMQYFSPDQLNPFDLNPLRNLLQAHVDFKALRQHAPVKLMIAATHANSGKLRLFRNHDLTLEAVLASACLPMVHRSVVIDGEPYWDGGFSANPAVFPLIQECDARDILLVLLSPLRYADTPSTAEEIRHRVMELGFSAAFLREMRTLAELQHRAQQSWLPIGRVERPLAKARFHLITAEEVVADLGSETKIAANLRFFEMLHRFGREGAAHWWQHHAGDLGQRASIDLFELFD